MNIDHLSINTIRFLVIDAVEQAQSGHVGTPMGLAPVAYTLWNTFLKHCPDQPDWSNRDRFVLSNGHASMLLYALLHLSGYDLSLDDLKNFRQFNSRTPGHPERGHTSGVEVTTGPLGQGFANAVGIAMAEAHLSVTFNQSDLPPLVDHFTYVMVSDGDMMEGISAEAASLAGHLQLGKLICLYDDNLVTIEGKTDLSFSEDTVARFKSYHWHTQTVADANDLDSVAKAIETAQQVTDRPSFITIRSIIGYGSPTKQGQSSVHSGALGKDEISATKRQLNWEYQESFYVPDDVTVHFKACQEDGKETMLRWQHTLSLYQEKYPELASEYVRRMSGDLPSSWDDTLPQFDADPIGIATRRVNVPMLSYLAEFVPELIGGSADLAPSNLSRMGTETDFSTDNYQGRNIHFGVREHAMGSICNGMVAHGGVLPYCATYLTFADYMRPAIRMSALMKLPNIFLFTHDSVAVGEDGPTHQPVEQIVGLRSIPNLTVLRPCDANEAAIAWQIAINNMAGPTCLILSRQNLPTLNRHHDATAQDVQKGAYILSDTDKGDQDLILIATGSEVHIALQVQAKLATLGNNAMVVSMPSWELFESQPKAYQQQVLPPSIKKRISIEAGSTLGWKQWVGTEGYTVGIDQFGTSGAGKTVLASFNMTVDYVVGLALSYFD